MDIVAVSGMAQGVGKSSFVEYLIKINKHNKKKNIGVIKTSIIKSKQSLAIDSQKHSALSNDTINSQTSGKDTERFRQAGADKVLFLRTDLEDLQEELQQAVEIFSGFDYLLIEGNSVLKFLNPDLIFYLERRGKSIKPSAQMAASRAHIIIAEEWFNIREGLDASILFDKLNFTSDRISCYQAHLLADLLNIAKNKLGDFLEQSTVKIKNCQLNLF